MNVELDCAAVRDALAAEPQARTPTLAAHLAACPECARYAAEMLALDARIRRALTVPVPEPAPPVAEAAVVDAGPRSARAPRRAAWSRGLALAAGIAGIAVLATLLWTGVPRDSLAGDLVAHMAEEPAAWQPNPAVPAASLAYVLGRSGVRLEPGAGEVTYAHSCWFRGHFVPHLAVRTEQGTVIVMVLPREHVRGRAEFAEEGYRGVIVPAARGALAVLARDGGGTARVDAATLDAVAARVRAAVRYVELDAG
jgi:hypothetical protein